MLNARGEVSESATGTLLMADLPAAKISAPTWAVAGICSRVICAKTALSMAR
ncbi:hypothetical protein LP415_26065 [Polaromonas sp. P1(28)-8]|nr:hypothetical protein LP415_26065 [Polaromonas sp. P1(28)-8]